MFIGIDGTRPSPNSAEDSPSIAGVMMSVDEQFTGWYD
jgi:hypothetical protein